MTPDPTPAVPPPIQCPRCGTELAPAAGAATPCPHCLFDLALAPPPSGAPGGAPGGAPDAGLPPLDELRPLLPDYELHTLLGRGGMGAVYRARHLRLDRLVAIKLLLPDLVADPEFAERFEREAKALARLAHPGIVGVHDFGRAGTFFFLVPEHVDGASLRELMTQGRLSPREALEFAQQLCDALQFAHDRGVVHRDVKPENVLVDADGRVRVADFGLAKLLGRDAAPLGLTRTRQALGTPHYMAPEQVRGDADVDQRADVYALGVVLYEMLTGELPIGRFPPPSQTASTPRSLDAVVMRTLENDPQRRYQTARDVARDLRSAHAATATGDERAAPATRAGREKFHRGDGGASPRPPAPRLRELPSWIPWRAWMAAFAVLASAFLPWIFVQPAELDMGPLVPLVGTVVATAWSGVVFGLPLWPVVPLALTAAAITTVRAAGWRVPHRAVPLVLATALLLAVTCTYACVAYDAASAGPGLLLALAVLGPWTWFALREPQVDRPQRRQRRAVRPDRR
jgi:hypothetical protein